MCVSFANERKTQVGWVVAIGWKTWKWVSVNNIPPKGSPCCVLDLDEMIVRSLCLKAFKEYNENGHVLNWQTNGKSWSKVLIQDYNSWKMVIWDTELNVFWTSTCNTTHSECRSNIALTPWTTILHFPNVATPN
jgi:hypothetical protein